MVLISLILDSNFKTSKRSNSKVFVDDSVAPINLAKPFAAALKKLTKPSEENHPSVFFLILSSVAARLLFLSLYSLVNEIASASALLDVVWRCSNNSVLLAKANKACTPRAPPASRSSIFLIITVKPSSDPLSPLRKSFMASLASVLKRLVKS